jgi:hypothetical protein
MPTQLPDPGRSPSSSRRLEVRIGRRPLLGAGVALAVALAMPEPAAAATKTGWRFCPKCRGLFAGKGTDRAGVCPAGGKHRPLTTINYVLHYDLGVTDPNLFKNWFRCTKCRGLVADDRGETGPCPAGGLHAITNPAYALWSGATIPGMDDAWDECAKCSGLFNWAGGNAGACPAGGGHVRSGETTRYTLFFLS